MKQIQLARSPAARRIRRNGMERDRSSEQLEYNSAKAQQPEQKQPYTPRPKSQIILAWVLIAIMVIAVLNICYWQIFRS